MGEYGGVVYKLIIGDLCSFNEEAFGHEWMPVVKVTELQGNAVLVLEPRAEKQGRIELQL